MQEHPTLIRRISRPAAVLRAGAVLVLSTIGLAVGQQSTASAFSPQGTFRPLAQLDSAYEPAQIQAAYNFAPLYKKGITGTGQTVALIETSALDRTGISRFDSQFNLPAPTISETYIGGKNYSLDSDPETNLDVEWLHALAPGAKIQIIYFDPQQPMTTGWKLMGKALNAAVSHGAGTVSISMGACAPTYGYTATSKALAKLEAQGVSVFVASGDDGDHPGSVQDCGPSIGVDYPAGDPSVVSVGGTSVTLDATNSIAEEIGWDLSGGGKAMPLTRPSWQIAPTMPQDNSRWSPDVSFLGDPNTGVAMAYGRKWASAGGTSLGAPAWAAAWALVRQSAQKSNITLQAAAPLIYRIGNSSSYARAFHDVASGSNGHYNAQAGWDPVTGWGTPNVAKLVSVAKTLSKTA